MSESPLDDVPDNIKILIGVVLLVWLLVGIVAFGNLLATLYPILAAFFLWLVLRFVRAHERIAAAEERRARAAERRADAAERPSVDTDDD